MHDSTRLKSQPHNRRREPPPSHHHRRAWCCSFTIPPHSPENPIQTPTPAGLPKKNQSLLKPEIATKSSSNSTLSSFANSPQNTSRPGIVTRIDPRRILSPGRVSPIDSIDETLNPINPVNFPEIPKSPSPVDCEQQVSGGGSGVRDDCNLGIFDVRLNLKGKNGSGLVLELNSEVLSTNSCVFADLIAKNSRGLCRIEVPEVENLGVFRETIELMFEDDIPRKLIRIGAYRAIDVLEVSAGIKFNRGVLSCLKYLEAVPWTEEEEEKLRSLFNKMKFDHETARDISARLYTLDMADSQHTLSKQLVWSVTTCVDANSRNELKSLVRGLLCKSSVYKKDCPDLNKADIFAVCQSCISSLVCLLEEATSTSPSNKFAKKGEKPLIERISKQVDNIIWLLEILLDHQMAEDLVVIWTNQSKLLGMHKCASPLVRYELSRVTAMLFIAMGTGKMHCRSEARSGLLQTWFRPMLLDFGWLQRCRKGLDMKALEEAMGQALLTLPLKEQYILFMDWFKCFSKHGTECPNLSKSFQIWWRRSFLRGSETHATESR
ncbi:BTB/POZ domain-containing protein At2g13690 [Nicotiana tomentosiformis]|uniref:BTB/POZ domain-containing protein At2g13690 n=1 Tax=Nicotiana tomentosiformis TaxID=4098 RepID=UPI00051C7669|nr:BTB/POZ domain-containing protein At2g13690 [Nicotiana tomentosiformis]